MVRKIKILILLNLCTVSAFGQLLVPVRDNANKAQLEKMVLTRWSHWVPNPATNIIGLPKNPVGYIYWRLAHHSYYKGPDRRPYRANGPFPANYASLLLQKKDDQKIADSTYAVFKTNLATYANMSGRQADIPWKIYFKKKFDGLFSEVPNELTLLEQTNVIAFNKITSDDHFQDYMNFLTISIDRVSAIHKALVDKGERILSYMKIMDEVASANNKMRLLIHSANRLTKSAPIEKIENTEINPQSFKNDKEIVNWILSNYQF